MKLVVCWAANYPCCLTQLPRFGFFLGPFGGGFQQLTAREGSILQDRFIISVRKKPFIVTNLS